MSIKFHKIKTCLELDDLLGFGQHSGRTVSYMLQFEPEYLLWATKQPNLLFLCEEAWNQLEKNAQRAKTEKQKQKFQVCEYPPWEDQDPLDDVPF